MLVLPFSVEPLGLTQAAVDHVHVPPRSGDAPFRFFLEGVQDVDGLRIADGVDRAPCTAFAIGDNFKYRAPSKSAQRFCRWIGFALLGGI
jgi:hypothetical protein